MSKADCENIAEMVEIYFFDNIRNDTDIDNIEYVRSIIRGIDALNSAEEFECKCSCDSEQLSIYDTEG